MIEEESKHKVTNDIRLDRRRNFFLLRGKHRFNEIFSKISISSNFKIDFHISSKQDVASSVRPSDKHKRTNEHHLIQKKICYNQ